MDLEVLDDDDITLVTITLKVLIVVDSKVRRTVKVVTIHADEILITFNFHTLVTLIVIIGIQNKKGNINGYISNDINT